MTSQPERLLVTKPISQDVLQRVYASDQGMYPAPLTLERLQSWVVSGHDLSSSWLDADLDSDKLIGVIIVLPVLRPHWEDLLVGKIRETQLDPSVFPAAFGSHEVGLHIFHVERFGDRVRGFTELAMGEVMARAKHRKWQVVGLSGTHLDTQVSFADGRQRLLLRLRERKHFGEWGLKPPVTLRHFWSETGRCI